MSGRCPRRRAVITEDLTDGVAIINAAAGRFDVMLVPDDTAELQGDFHHVVELTDLQGRVATLLVGRLRVYVPGALVQARSSSAPGPADSRDPRHDPSARPWSKPPARAIWGDVVEEARDRQDSLNAAAAALDVLRAAPPEQLWPVLLPWRPMGEAPKDGSRVLARPRPAHHARRALWLFLMD